MEDHGRLRHPGAFALFIAALAFSGAGCFALTSPGPVGPMRTGTATQLSASWAYAYGPATATVGGQTVTGNGQMQSGVGIPTALPATVGFRQAIGDAAELSGDLGAMDSGFRLRAGTPIEARVPFDISLEARFGEISLVPTGSYQGRVAFEIYPNVTTAHSFPPRWQILSIGLAGGVFQHQLSLPLSFDADDDLPFGGPSMTLLRPEVRLETAVGIYLGGKSEGVSIVVAPWILLGSRAPTSATCALCGSSALSTPFSVTSYSQNWGASLIVTPSYGWLHAR